MVLKVDNDELKNFTRNMSVDSDDLNAEIEKMSSLIDTLGSIWQGVDATEFQKNMKSYLEKMKKIPTAINALATVTDRLNDGYSEKNNAFTKTLEEVKNRYAK